MTILLADDNAPSRELMREILEACGYDVAEAANGREALDLICKSPPDIVLLDLQMPIMDGFAVIHAVRSDERLRLLTVIALTASAMLGDRERAIAAGFDSYIAKPINLENVRDQIRQITTHKLERSL
jgi:two-component system, cell cycle response regulator DivK